MRVLGKLFAVTAVSLGCGVATAGAALPVKVDVKAGGAPLASGAPLVFSTSSFKMVMKVAGSTSLNCTEVAVTGTLTKNQSTIDSGAFSEATFAGGDPSREGACESEDNFVVTGSIGGFTLRNNGKVELKELTIEADPPLPHTAKFGLCRFHNLVVHATATTSTSEPGEPLEVTVADQIVRIVPNSGKECGSGAFLTTTFTVTSGGLGTIALLES